MAQSIFQEFFVAFIVLLPILIYLVYLYFIADQTPPITHILDGTIAGHRRMVISQNPGTDMARTIYPSDGRKGQKDLEFTYSWWMAVSDYEGRAENPQADRDEKMKGRTQVWHKGSAGAFPLRGPGVFFKNVNGQPNVMEVQLNTFADPVETIEVGNLPIDKWFHCVLTVEGRSVKLYINGRLKASKELKGIVRLNYGNVYIGENKGFAGYLSNLTQKNYVVSYSEIATDIRGGPSTKVVGDVIADAGNRPPYFHNRWWLNY